MNISDIPVVVPNAKLVTKKTMNDGGGFDE